MRIRHFMTALIISLGMIIPGAASAGPVNATAIETGTATGKAIRYIRPPAKPERKRSVTPYGDFCTHCSKYGIGRQPVSLKDSLAAMDNYFKAKGLTVKNVKGRGRFLKAEIYRDEMVVDRVLFDRRTGRLRSIY